MDHISSTPFGRRTVSAGLLAAQAVAARPAPMSSVDKWALFRDLTTARRIWKLSSRDLTVLNALLSFHPGKMLEDGAVLIVFPSNRVLADRAHGMAESTLRRHLAALVASGLILRNDSPNGKRYAARDASGALARAFGFDLRPLLVRAREIFEAATESRAQIDACRRNREVASLRLRDATKLIEYGQEVAPEANWGALAAATGEVAKHIRRKLCPKGFEALAERLRVILQEIRLRLPKPPETAELSTMDSENERHYQNSEPYTLRTEDSSEIQLKTQITPQAPKMDQAEKTPLKLNTVLEACPSLAAYENREISEWRHLVATADYLRPMLGISPDIWHDAGRIMGRQNAAISLVCILERARNILSPGGYLRTLTRKSAEGSFSPTAMVRALLHAPNRVTA